MPEAFRIGVLLMESCNNETDFTQLKRQEEGRRISPDGQATQQAPMFLN